MLNQWLIVFLVSFVTYGFAFDAKKTPSLEEKGNSNNLKGCDYSIIPSWTSKIGGGIVQSPQITDFFNDDAKEIILPTYKRYLEVISGKDGSEVEGFPFTHPSFSSVASPILYDITEDGEKEVVVSTYDGKILFFAQNGNLIKSKTIQIPPLEVPKFWFDAEKMKEFKDENKKKEENAGNIRKDNLENENTFDEDEEGSSNVDFKGWFSDFAQESMDILHITPTKEFIESEEAMEAEEQEIFESPKFKHRIQEMKDTLQSDNILVDAHLMSEPVIVDLEHNGKDKLIVCVSYFFDLDYYSVSSHISKLPKDIDLKNYIGGGIIAIDLETYEITWKSHLDLTSYKDNKKAFVYSSPTLIDLTSNGSYEILMSNSIGHIYVLDKHGKVLPGFPVTLPKGIQGQVIAEDINRDGFIELCAIDVSSNLKCFDHDANLLWEYKLEGNCDHKPVLADLNSNGNLEILIGTSTGSVVAIEGKDGSLFYEWKINTPIHTPLTVLNFNSSTPDLDILVRTTTGKLFILNTACTQVFEIGEYSYSPILVDDLSGNGYFDLLSASVSGEISIFQTKVPYHPLSTTSGPPNFANGLVYRKNWHGVYFTKDSRRFRDVIGQTMEVEFEIIDRRTLPERYPKNYNIKIGIGNKHILFGPKIYRQPGKYKVKIDCPRERGKFTVSLSMVNEVGQLFVDDIALSFNVSFIKIMKWTVVFPFAFACILMLVMQKTISNPSLPQ